MRTGVADASEIPHRGRARSPDPAIRAAAAPSCDASARRARAIAAPLCGRPPGAVRRRLSEDRRSQGPPRAGGARREAPEGLYAFRPDPATGEFPLALISPATNRTISSTSRPAARAGRCALEMHPDDAAARGLATGDRVRICEQLRRGDLPAARLDADRARVSSSCRRGSGATTPTTAPPPAPSPPTRSPTSAAAPASTTPASKSRPPEPLRHLVVRRVAGDDGAAEIGGGALESDEERRAIALYSQHRFVREAASACRTAAPRQTVRGDSGALRLVAEAGEARAGRQARRAITRQPDRPQLARAESWPRPRARRSASVPADPPDSRSSLRPRSSPHPTPRSRPADTRRTAARAAGGRSRGDDGTESWRGRSRGAAGGAGDGSAARGTADAGRRQRSATGAGSWSRRRWSRRFGCWSAPTSRWRLRTAAPWRQLRQREALPLPAAFAAAVIPHWREAAEPPAPEQLVPEPPRRWRTDGRCAPAPRGAARASSFTGALRLLPGGRFGSGRRS